MGGVLRETGGINIELESDCGGDMGIFYIYLPKLRLWVNVNKSKFLKTKIL